LPAAGIHRVESADRDWESVTVFHRRRGRCRLGATFPAVATFWTSMFFSRCSVAWFLLVSSASGGPAEELAFTVSAECRELVHPRRAAPADWSRQGGAVTLNAEWEKDRSKPWVIERSEERRVGKECKSRWWPSHIKKKQC